MGLSGALIAAVALSFGPVAPSSAAEPSSVRAADDAAQEPPAFGAVYHGMWDLSWRQRSQLLDRLERTGARWVRIGVPWSAVQPREPTADDPGWGMGWGVPKADRVIAMAHRQGFRISVTLHRTPGWANGDRGPDYLPDDLGDYARAAQWLAHRYRGSVQSWEVWNEPNNDNHMRGGGAPRYTALLCRAYDAVHRGDPRSTVVFGGTSGNAWGFIAQAYEAGAKGCFDVLATHPYNQDRSPRFEPPNDRRWWFKNIRLVRDVMVRNDDAATPVWFTEVGWSTHPNTESTPSWQRGVTREEQARYAAQLLRITARDYPYVERICWYSARDEQTGDVENDNFGLFTAKLRPKPAAIRVRQVLSRSG